LSTQKNTQKYFISRRCRTYPRLGQEPFRERLRTRYTHTF